MLFLQKRDPFLQLADLSIFFLGQSSKLIFSTFALIFQLAVLFL